MIVNLCGTEPRLIIYIPVSNNDRQPIKDLIGVAMHRLVGMGLNRPTSLTTDIWGQLFAIQLW